MIKTINLNEREISYDLEYKDVKNINLRIKADQSIYMSANHRVSDKIIEEFYTLGLLKNIDDEIIEFDYSIPLELNRKTGELSYGQICNTFNRIK